MSDFGTWMAIECTFSSLVALTPAAELRSVRRAEDVEVLERAQVAQVEDRAQVDVEALGALAGEDLAAVAERVHGRLGELLA